MEWQNLIRLTEVSFSIQTVLHTFDMTELSLYMTEVTFFFIL